MSVRSLTTLTAAALLASACGSGAEQPATSSDGSTVSVTTSTVVSEDPGPVADIEDEAADIEEEPDIYWKPSVDPTYEVTVTTDVVYGQGEVDGGGAFDDLLLDLYVPDVDGQDRFPLVVTIHGGGFIGGSKNSTTFVSRQFAQRGYIVASIDYRVAGDSPVPSSRFDVIYDDLGRPEPSSIVTAVVAAMDDTMMAIDFMQARPDVEPGETVLWGNSAGAITALFVGYGMDDFGIERPPISAVISNSGGFVGQRTAAELIEEERGVIDDPTYSYSEGPMFLTHATGDPVVAYQLSQDIVDRAEAIGHPYESFFVDADSHGIPGGIFRTEFSPGVSVFQAQVNWLDSFLVGVAETS